MILATRRRATRLAKPCERMHHQLGLRLKLRSISSVLKCRELKKRKPLDRRIPMVLHLRGTISSHGAITHHFTMAMVEDIIQSLPDTVIMMKDTSSNGMASMGKQAQEPLDRQLLSLPEVAMQVHMPTSAMGVSMRIILLIKDQRTMYQLTSLLSLHPLLPGREPV